MLVTNDQGVIAHALSRCLSMFLLAQMLLWGVRTVGMTYVSGLGVAQSLVYLFVWTMMLYAAERDHMATEMPLNTVG